MRYRSPIAALLLAFLLAGCEEEAPERDRAGEPETTPAADEREEEAPEFEPLDGRFTVDTARVPGSEPRAP
jgi:hypothetical protein